MGFFFLTPSPHSDANLPSPNATLVIRQNAGDYNVMIADANVQKIILDISVFDHLTVHNAAAVAI